MNPHHICFDWRESCVWQMIQYLIYSSLLYVTLLIHLGFHSGILIDCSLFFLLGVDTHMLVTPKYVHFEENGLFVQRIFTSTCIPYTSIHAVIPISHPHSSIPSSFEIRGAHAIRILVLHDLTEEKQQEFFRTLFQKNPSLSNNNFL
ncbi:hypothetical protein [Bacillus sp. NPDC094106]|uniref:hypothetical protein n=1 Tax=Bacillus sp. NPDC094106 TaxID=3363949 RepID=UPI0037F11477